MLIKCPECELFISDKALSCPHCGYPMKKQLLAKRKYSKNKRKRLPNGFGQITKLSNKKLRKPYRAMVTIGKNEDGRPICKLLKPEAYFETYNDAYAALVSYNKNPYDLDPSLTVQELYEDWIKDYFKKVKLSTSTRTITTIWPYCHSIYKMRASDVRVRHIKHCIEEASRTVNGKIKKASPSIQIKMKSLFNLMFDHATEYEIVDKNYARMFKLSKDYFLEKEKLKTEHIPFTKDEMDMLWNNVDRIPYVDVVLIQCYSGWRPQELGLLKIDDVDLSNWTYRGGMKTKAGTNRLVPIHSKIRPLIKKRYEEAREINSEYLINCMDCTKNSKDNIFSYDRYKYRFSKIIDTLHLDTRHRTHDCRTHFITMAKRNGVDEYAIKYIVGHAINDITEKIYTEREMDWLLTEIEKIKE